MIYEFWLLSTTDTFLEVKALDYWLIEGSLLSLKFLEVDATF